MGGNQSIYLQEFDLYELLESILGKLNNWEDSSETIESFTTKFTRTSCTCSYNLTNGCPLTTAVRSWRQKSRNKIRTTKRGLVWEVRNSVHTPLGKDFCSSLRTNPNTQVGCTIQAFNIPMHFILFYISKIILLNISKIILLNISKIFTSCEY